MIKSLSFLLITMVAISDCCAQTDTQPQDKVSVSSTQNTWVQATPGIKESDLTFMQAVKLGNTGVVASTIAKVGNVDDKQDGHYSPLFFASAKGYQDIARMLIKKGANVNAVGRGGWTPLMAASMHGQLGNIGLLMDNGANLEAHSEQGLTALMIAVKYSQLASVRLLIQRGGNVNAWSHNLHGKDKSVLTLAVESKNMLIASQLLQAGAKVNAKERNGKTALMYAVESHQGDMVKLLLAKGAKIQQLDANGNNSLHWTAAYGNPEILQLLLRRGGKPHQQNLEGDTALLIAARRGAIENMEILVALASVQQMQLAFHEVVKSGVTTAVKKMITLGADINSKNSNGKTALMLAVMNRHHLVVDVLLNEGANSQIVSNVGKDALMYALETPQPKERILTSLLKKGGNVQRKDQMGNTALHIATNNLLTTDFPVIDVLLQAGAKTDERNNAGKRAGDILKERMSDSSLSGRDIEYLRKASMML